MTTSPVEPSPSGLPSWDISLSLDSRPPLNPTRQHVNNPNLVRHKGDGPDTTTSSTWLPHGPTRDGLLIHPDQSNLNCRSKAPPSIATRGGRLWMVWADFDGQILYNSTVPRGNSEVFGRREKFPYYEGRGTDGVPVIANLNGVLHAAIVSADTGAMAHFTNDADDEHTWIHQRESLPEGCVAAKGCRSPALAAFHNKLFLAFIGPDQKLFGNQWDADAQAWSSTQCIFDGRFQGKPALFVLNGALHVLCGAADPGGTVLGYRYDYSESGWAWNPASDVSEGRATSGVSAASYGKNAYLGFLQGDAVHVAVHADGEPWGEPERVGSSQVKARFAPEMAVMNGRVHCVFAGKWDGDLHWFSRPVLGYDLKTWMGSLDDGAWLSNLTIPGTHDSCARSNLPFVRTQYLSISQQLALGIRFFDLRLRRHGDGKLYCYHGGVPINMPRVLPFEGVMDEVWDFIGPGDGRNATETVLICIDNDDRSKEQESDPKVFYNAVKEAIDSTPTYDDGSRRWYTDPVTARLGDVRGKAVLLRRYYGDTDVEPTQRMGLDLEIWCQNDPDFTIVTPSGVRVRLQDKWKYSERSGLEELVSSKMAFVKRMMGRAAGTLADSPAGEDEAPEPEKTWFINFCSAVGEPIEHGEVAEAKWIAVGAHSNLHFFGKWIEGVNTRTRDYLCELDEGARRGGTRRLGVINLDYPELPEDSDLVARLIQTNF